MHSAFGFLLLLLSETIAHRVAKDRHSNIPPDLPNFKVGDVRDGDGVLVPSLVPPPGTTYTFKIKQYKHSALSKMEYDWQLSSVNDKEVNVRFAWSKGAKVFKAGDTTKDQPQWKLRRRYGFARFVGGHLTDSLYFLKATDQGQDKDDEGRTIAATQKNWKDSHYTIRRAALSIPQRWAIHKGFTMGGPPGTKGAKQYSNTLLYWIRGHMGTYNVFRSPADSAMWHCAFKRETHSHCRKDAYKSKSKDEVEALRVATFKKKVESGRMTHTVVVKEGVDSALMLSMLSVFRWEHFVGVAQTLMPIAQMRGDYQPDDGAVLHHSSGKRPSLIEGALDLDSEDQDEAFEG